jgi:hypothetical protein
MTDSRSGLKARAAALFRELVAQGSSRPLAEDRVRVDRPREKMAKLRAVRLAADGSQAEGVERLQGKTTVKFRLVSEVRLALAAMRVCQRHTTVVDSCTSRLSGFGIFHP